MPRLAREMTALDVKRLTTPGVYAVGGVNGLNLQVSQAESRSWILRIRIEGKRREMGLGSYPTVTLAAAREAARELYEQVRQGRNPLEERKIAQAEARARTVTFRMVAESWLAEKLKEIKGEKNQGRYRGTIDIHAAPLMDKAAAVITMNDVLNVLKPIWETKTVTAGKVRERLEKIFDRAIAEGVRTTPNPSVWKGNLSAVLPSPGRISQTVHQPALAANEISEWWSDAIERDGVSALALQFLALTAVRSGEVRGAVWSEIDEPAKIWAIPGDRMKIKGRAHRVPLTDAALDVLRQARALAGSTDHNPDPGALVFPAPRGGVLSDMAVSMLMRRMHTDKLEADGIGWIDPRSMRPMVPHGLRTVFRSSPWKAVKFERARHDELRAYDFVVTTLKLVLNGNGFTLRAYKTGEDETPWELPPDEVTEKIVEAADALHTLKKFPKQGAVNRANFEDSFTPALKKALDDGRLYYEFYDSNDNLYYIQERNADPSSSVTASTSLTSTTTVASTGCMDSRRSSPLGGKVGSLAWSGASSSAKGRRR